MQTNGTLFIIGRCLILLSAVNLFLTRPALTQTNLPSELTGPPKVVHLPSDTDRELSKVLDQIHDEKATKANYDLLNRFVAEHPNYSPGYAMRAVLSCEIDSPNVDQLESDVRRAMSDPESKRLVESLQSVFAKIDFAQGRYEKTVEELYTAISADWGNADHAFNISSVRPEKSAAFCTWNLEDLDVLAKQFPRDWRIPVFRGIFYQFFTTFGDESFYTSAAAQFRIAEALNPNSAIPPFLLGELQSKASFWSKKSWTSDEARKQHYQAAAALYTQAIQRDPHFLNGYLRRAGAYLESKQDALAIQDYTKVLLLDPQNSTALADRGNAYSDKGESYKAIADFTSAIPIEEKEGDDYLENLYQNRGDEYAKVGDYESAIRDYTSALARQFGSSTILLSVAQIRKLYPELSNMNDAAVVRMMHDQFNPNIDFDQFSDYLLHKNGDWLMSPLMTDIYEKRGDAYLKVGDFKKGVGDFQRIYRGAPNLASSTDRWRNLGWSRGGDTYLLDVKASDTSTSEPHLWVKKQDAKGSELIEFILDCSSRRISVTSSIQYDRDDHIIHSSDVSSGWSSVVPDSLGEQLWNGGCEGHN